LTRPIIPDNTGSAFTHYDDGFENTIWLGLMRDRVKMLYKLLADDGSLCILIDDAHCHYLKVICDEVFGLTNFVANVVWQKRTSPEARLGLGAARDHILVYAKNVNEVDINKQKVTEPHRAPTPFWFPDRQRGGTHGFLEHARLPARYF